MVHVIMIFGNELLTRACSFSYVRKDMNLHKYIQTICECHYQVASSTHRE